MGGGKKKGIANKLAKMSDEERARYLQRRADVEEEAKKRKEQLISTFLKNKIKKEDGFSRLNLAKINQQWHHLLRVNKCKQMKEDVEHMKKYIERVVNYKNRIINKLLEELEMAEEQYSHNYQTHSLHIDQIIESHNHHLKSLNSEYTKDLDELLTTTKAEEKQIIENSTKEQEHLQTIIFSEEASFKQYSKAQRERFLLKKEDSSSTWHIALKGLIKRREKAAGAIWKQISGLVEVHVQQVDTRRHHLAELKRLDCESAVEVQSNQERINTQEEEIQILRQQYKELTSSSHLQTQTLTQQLQLEDTLLKTSRASFRKELTLDNQKLLQLTQHSNNSLQNLSLLLKKGESIIKLMDTCKSLETEKDHLEAWLPPVVVEEPLEVPPVEAVEEVEIKMGKAPRSSPHTLTEGFNFLEALEGFWVGYNRVCVEVGQLEEDKKLLLKGNKNVRGVLRGALEAAALGEVGTRAVSTRVGSKSAPLRRVVI